jgi:hypothetical protein
MCMCMPIHPRTTHHKKHTHTHNAPMSFSSRHCFALLRGQPLPPGLLDVAFAGLEEVGRDLLGRCCFWVGLIWVWGWKIGSVGRSTFIYLCTHKTTDCLTDRRTGQHNGGGGLAPQAGDGRREAPQHAGLCALVSCCVVECEGAYREKGAGRAVSID